MASNSSLPVDVKIIFVGEQSVGKTSMLLRFTDMHWTPEMGVVATTGVDFRVNRSQVQGVFVVYDVTKRETFNALLRWFTELEMHASSSVVKVVVGNKIDKDDFHQVRTAEGKAFAESKGALYFETSAQPAAGIHEAFVEVVENVLNNTVLVSNAVVVSNTVEAAPPRPSQDQLMLLIDSSSGDDPRSGGPDRGCAC